MAKTYYPQSDFAPPTMTVGDLIERLRQFEPTSLVVFRSPLCGVFGSNTAYSIDAVEKVSMPREEINYPAYRRTDEETGEEFDEEAYTQVKTAWSGVVIT